MFQVFFVLNPTNSSQGDDAVILHYPNAGLMNWRRKYESSSTISKIESATSIWPSSRLPLASSAVVSGGSRRDQDLFYRTFIMQNEHNEMATLMNFLYFSFFIFCRSCSYTIYFVFF